MKNLLKSDAIMLMTTRTAQWWAGVMLVLTLLGCLVSIIWFPDSFEISRNLRGFNPVLFLFAMVTVTSGFRHKVAVTEQLIGPRVLPGFLSKMVVFGACGFLFELLQIALIVLCFALAGQYTAHGSDLLFVGISALGCALSAVLGVLIARLVRVPVGAILVTLVYALALEPALQSPLMTRIFKIDPALYAKLTKVLPGIAFQDIFSVDWQVAVSAFAFLLGWVFLLSLGVLSLDRRREAR